MSIYLNREILKSICESENQYDKTIDIKNTRDVLNDIEDVDMSDCYSNINNILVVNKNDKFYVEYDNIKKYINATGTDLSTALYNIIEFYNNQFDISLNNLVVLVQETKQNVINDISSNTNLYNVIAQKTIYYIQQLKSLGVNVSTTSYKKIGDYNDNDSE